MGKTKKQIPVQEEIGPEEEIPLNETAPKAAEAQSEEDPAAKEMELLVKVKDHLESGEPALSMAVKEEEKEW